MTSKAKLGVVQGTNERESWIVELALPGLFTVVLIICLVHLAVSVLSAQKHQSRQAEYAISAFAN